VSPHSYLRLFSRAGSFALQFAVAAGAVVIATSSSKEKLAFAQELGATHLINYKETPEWYKEVNRIVSYPIFTLLDDSNAL